MMIGLVRRHNFCNPSDTLSSDLSDVKHFSLSHIVVNLDMQLGEVKSQLTRLAELDMKNYFVLGR